MSNDQFQALAQKVLGEDGNANELLDAVAQLARTGNAGQQTAMLSGVKELLRAMANRAPAGSDLRSDLVQAGHQVNYTEKMVEDLKNGDYVSLVGMLPDLFDPNLPPEQRQALRETLRRFEPEIRATETLMREKGDIQQRSKLGRFMNARRDAIDLYDSTGGQLPQTNQLQQFLDDITGAAGGVIDELEDFRTMFAKALGEVSGLLDSAVGKAFDHVDDDEARNLINLLNAKDGREGDAASLLAYLPFDAKAMLINDIIDSGFGDGVLDDDEQAILDVLRETMEKDPAEFFRLVNAVGFDKLDTHVQGDEWDEFMRLMKKATQGLAA
ncbi:MAG: hypothetical protein AAF628_07715 [Planctomycetota bacterium]